jgi:hypothetical protein
MMGKGGLGLLRRAGQGYPGLDAEELALSRPVLERRALGVDNAAPAVIQFTSPGRIG